MYFIEYTVRVTPERDAVIPDVLCTFFAIPANRRNVYGLRLTPYTRKSSGGYKDESVHYSTTAAADIVAETQSESAYRRGHGSDAHYDDR